MIIYIAGKMTGKKDFGRAKFAAAEDVLRGAGHVVLNPGRLPIGLKDADYMPICLAMIDAAEAVFRLEDWQDSVGAKLELAYAARREKKIMGPEWDGLLD